MTINNYNVHESVPSSFRAISGKNGIYFTAEYKNGLYFNIKSVWNEKRTYTAQRYTYKYIGVVREIAFELLKAGKLWDYVNGCPALETYKKDIKPYYDKCKANGLSMYADADFMTSLFLED